MQKKFLLFHKADVSSTVKFASKIIPSLENDIKRVEIYHSKELERDLMIEKITSRIVKIIMSRNLESLSVQMGQSFETRGSNLLDRYFSEVAAASGQILRIIRISVKGNKQMIFQLRGIEQKIVLIMNSTGKRVNGVDNILAITKNQIEWRLKVTKFLEDMWPIVKKIKETVEEKNRQITKHDQIQELQRELYQIIKDELGILDANINLENLEEHEDKICEYFEEYYFRKQRTTIDIDTKLVKRRKQIKKLKDLLKKVSANLRIDMFLVTSLVIHYPRVLAIGDVKFNHMISSLRKQHSERIKKSRVNIPTRRGYPLKGVYFEKEGCRKVIVMLNTIMARGFQLLMQALEYSRDYNILIYTGVGHIGSYGHGGLGVEESKDFRDVLDWLIDEKQNNAIGVYGVSLGGSAAIGGIATYSRQQYIKAAVFQAAFADRDQTLNEYYTDMFKMPDCKLRRLIKFSLDFYLTKEGRNKHNNNYKPKELIRGIACPIFLIHDIEDRFTRFHHALDLKKNVRSSLKTYFRHGTEHYSPTNKMKMYLVFQFLKKYLGK